MDIIQGLAYLHGHEPSIIHADLKGVCTRRNMHDHILGKVTYSYFVGEHSRYAGSSSVPCRFWPRDGQRFETAHTYSFVKEICRDHQVASSRASRSFARPRAQYQKQ